MPITIPMPAGPPKRRLIEMAYAKCSLAGYEFGRTPEEIDDAMSELNAMMLEWPFSGLGYIQPTYGVGDADELSNIPPETLAAVATQLALRLAPNMGKTLSPEANAAVSRSMGLLHARQAAIPTQPMQSHTPRGMGGDHGAALRGPFIEETFGQVNPVVTTGSTTLGSNVLIVASAIGILAGANVSGNGIPSGATVIAISGNSVTISTNATATASGVTLTFR